MKPKSLPAPASRVQVAYQDEQGNPLRDVDVYVEQPCLTYDECLTVRRHTEGLTSLVDDLLSLSRLDSASPLPSPRPVHLGKVAQKVSESMTPRAHKMGHRLVLQIADGLPAVIGNAEYLERALYTTVPSARWFR